MVTAPHHDSYRRIAAEETFCVPEVRQDAERVVRIPARNDTAVS
jgi:hypothetical protein